jgi:cytochrome P450
MASHEALGPLLTTPDYQAFCRVELDDPYELLDTLRSIAPVHWSPLLHAWVVTSYQDVTAALGHPRLSSDRSAINARGIPDVLRPTYGSLIAHISNWLGFTDPPRHSRLRRLARSMLNPAALADLTLGGATIRAGDPVIVHLAGANRDPAAFDDPATFDVTARTTVISPSGGARTSAWEPRSPERRRPWSSRRWGIYCPGSCSTSRTRGGERVT